MIKQEKSIVIHRPIEEVFDYVSDQRNTPPTGIPPDGGLCVPRDHPAPPVSRPCSLTLFPYALCSFRGRSL